MEFKSFKATKPFKRGTAPKLHEFQRPKRFDLSFAVICLREIAESTTVKEATDGDSISGG